MRKRTDEDESEEYLRSERQTHLLEHVLMPSSPLACTDDALRHLKEGFGRRLLMIETGYQYILEVTGRREKERLSPYESTDLSIQLNALYLNIVGALDNLGWATKYELDIMPAATDFAGPRSRVGLFAKDFIAAVARARPALAATLISRLTWYADLRELRDPAAHRIPIYPVPGVLDAVTLEEYNRLQAESESHFLAGRYSEGMNLQFASSRVGTYVPWMSLAVPGGHVMRPIPAQIRADYDGLLDVSEMVLAEVFSFRKRR